jgi:TRAP-type C4-dicarboxylate transport system permease large subunit
MRPEPARKAFARAETTRGCQRRLREQWTAFRESVWGLLLIAIVLGGICGGIFTPTETAAVVAVYAFFITVFVYRDCAN